MPLLSSILLILSFLVSCVNQSKESQSNYLSQDDRAMIDSIIASKYNSHPIPGLAVGLVAGDQTYIKTIGYSDMEKLIGFADSTVFCAGVVSETFTVSLAMALKHHFEVDLNEPVSKYLPHFALNSNTYKNITINHLLTQTSGVPRHGVFWDFPDWSDSALWQTTWSIRLQEPEFETPGTKVVRSPYNFDIAADLIAHASHTRFEDFASKYLIEPLQMKHSTYDNEKIFNSNFAKPHQISNWLTFQFEPTTDYPINGEHAGSIGWHTSIEDATHWISMLLNGGKFKGKQILPAKLVRQMMTPAFKTDQSGSYIGLGWEIQTVTGMQVFIKSGVVGAFENALVIIPELEMGVMVAVNAQNDFMPAIFAQELLFSIKNRNVPQYRPSIHYEMGSILYSTQSIDEAIAFYTETAQNKPELYDCSDLALSQLGANLFYRLGSETEALRIYETCITVFPNSVYSYLNYAEYYLYKKDVERTEKELAWVDKLANNEPDVISRTELIKGALELIKEKMDDEPGELAEAASEEEICIPCEDETK